jgi:hypothetical protein
LLERAGIMAIADRMVRTCSGATQLFRSDTARV